MKIDGKEAVCSECGSTDVRSVPLAIADSLIECRDCGVGALRSEFNLWCDTWKQKNKKEKD